MQVNGQVESSGDRSAPSSPPRSVCSRWRERIFWNNAGPSGSSDRTWCSTRTPTLQPSCSWTSWSGTEAPLHWAATSQLLCVQPAGTFQLVFVVIARLIGNISEFAKSGETPASMNSAGNRRGIFLPLENLRLSKGVNKHKQPRAAALMGFIRTDNRRHVVVPFEVISLVFPFISFVPLEFFKTKTKISSNVTTDQSNL